MSLEKILFKLYGTGRRSMRKIALKLIHKYEGGEFYSPTLRKIFLHYHKVEIGLYTHGGCFVPYQIDKHTTIGRYCSIAASCRAMNRNHPMDFKSMHAFFFNPRLGYMKDDTVPFTPLEIGNDVWIGHNALIMPHVRSIADGAVIAAGAVVNKDVPPYGVVVGNPARVVRYRFPPEVIEQLLASRWWDKSMEELRPDLQEFHGPYGGAGFTGEGGKEK